MSTSNRSFTFKGHIVKLRPIEKAEYEFAFETIHAINEYFSLNPILFHYKYHEQTPSFHLLDLSFHHTFVSIPACFRFRSVAHGKSFETPVMSYNRKFSPHLANVGSQSDFSTLTLTWSFQLHQSHADFSTISVP